jgi:CDP-diacylglycerol--glycerol-3-phosphate 3-phosphatidyltransferase
MHFKMCNVPTTLTLIRLIGSPLILPIALVYFLPTNNFTINILLAILFVFFGLTDFFDGYLARRFKQETPMGSILDPIADKFLVYSVLIALLRVSKINFFVVVVLIGREFFMMGLRQVALEYHMSVPVVLWGKLKTFAQICFLTVIIANPYQELGVFSGRFNQLEFFLLIITLLLSVGSAMRYYSEFITEYEHQQQVKSGLVKDQNEENS